MNVDKLRRYVLRVLAILFCLGALADLGLDRGPVDEAPIAVIDVSASMGPKGPEVPAGVRVGSRWILVAAGVQEVIGGAEPVRLKRSESRFGEALRYAAERYPGRTLLLLSDGRGTDGDAEAGAAEVRSRGGRVFTAPPREPAADVALLRASVVRGAQSPVIRARIGSSTTGEALVQLSREGRIVDRKRVQLEPGLEQEIRLRDPAPPVGGGTYHVAIVPDRGTPNDDRGNDQVALGLRPEKRVALIWGLGSAAVPASASDLDIRSAQRLDSSDLEGADCLVMSNIPWRDIGIGLCGALERFAAGGGWILVLGGPDAYAGGGWSGTPFESNLGALRVRRKEGVGLALVLAVDRSGSTHGATLARLKEAVRHALRGVAPGERIAVLPFAGRPAQALLAPGPLAHGDRQHLEQLLEAVDALEAGGATDLPRAIAEATRRVAGLQARERRVIVLTDGDPERPPDLEALGRARRLLDERGVQFGALVVGDALAAARLRESLARRPQDVRLLSAGDVAQLTEHLLRELGDLRNRSARLPRPSRLTTLPDHAVPFDAEGFLPRELQHLEVAVGEGAYPLLIAEYDDTPPPTAPFAALRPVGAGGVASLAWGPQLESAHLRPAAWVRLRPWIAALASRSDRGLVCELDGEDLVVRVEAAAGAGQLEARAPAGTSSLIEVSPGLFRGPLPTGAGEGVSVRSSAPGQPALERPLRLPARPPAEHRGAGVDLAALEAIATAGGGRRLGAGIQPPGPESGRTAPLAPWLLLLACILLVVDRLLAKPDEIPTDSRGTRSP